MTSTTSIVRLTTPVETGTRLYDHYQTAQLARVSTRSLLKYWRYGIIKPKNRGERYGIYFEEEAIYRVRKAENIRATMRTDIASAAAIFKLIEENEHLKTELRFIRKL